MKDIDQPELNEEERDRLVRVFKLLISMDKKQDPETYSVSSDTKDLP